jgi:hypothetical protein
VDPQLLELALVFERECHFSHHFHPEERAEAVASTLTGDSMEDVAIVARAMNAFLAARLGE